MHNKAETFFKDLEFTPAMYQSPLSKNNNWLKPTTNIDHSEFGNYKNLISFIEDNAKPSEIAEFLAILDGFVNEFYNDPAMTDIFKR